MANALQEHLEKPIPDVDFETRLGILASQVPTTHWHEHLNDETLADAILDRLLHNAIRLELKGDPCGRINKPFNTILNAMNIFFN